MTARSHTEDEGHGDLAPIVVDLAEPGVYIGLVRTARAIEKHVRAMPLEAMSAAADDACKMLLLGRGTVAQIETVRRDREIIAVLAFAQKRLQKIRARYGE